MTTTLVFLGIAIIAVGAVIILFRVQMRRKTAELVESQNLFATVANTSPALVWLAGLDKGCIWFNEPWLAFVGRTPEQEQGNGWAEGVHPDDFDRCLQIYNEAFDARQPFSMVYRLRRHDGVYCWLLDQGHPRYDAAGNFVGYIGSCLDISEQKQAEKELQDKNTELENFTHTVSHDLKSPLITIQSFAGLIMQDLEQGKHKNIPDDLQRIITATVKMNDLLNGLLELSRIGRLMNPPVPVDMNQVVDNILAQLTGPLSQRQVKVVVQPALPAVIGDAQRIEEVVQNLVENAIKYMGDQAAPRITIGSRSDGSKPVFWVSDNGIGIEPRLQESIFGMFKKLDPKSAGTGIGLALVKKIVEVHGGRVWVESEGAGRGSTFCFTMPKTPGNPLEPKIDSALTESPNR